ncbi:hypothetical protein MAMP_01880 [Methylophaga aminisulfidivorans MP]|uniref:EF-hand domain-containing protein n=1 Tax=Methylophaga aminisulfidivorans MP TaxID=1026882 RepID=F5SWZ3_9GAMM|nr:hypothetical protein [Methylophaga aminisulfidivorans]EGL54886.1 hypothetical protein MAMP_01880 [Methylophaga aminisulfidivorans MP]
MLAALGVQTVQIEAILYLLFLFGSPFIIYVLSRVNVLPIKGLGKLAGISFAVLYIFIVGSAEFADYQLKQELDSFDLDGDGSFSSNEFTPEAEEAMNRYIQDTGRTFAPITGFIFSSIYVGLVFIFIRLFNKYVLKNT